MIKPFRRTSCNDHDTFSSPAGHVAWDEVRWHSWNGALFIAKNHIVAI